MSILGEILRSKVPEVAAARLRKPLSALEEEVANSDAVRPLAQALRRSAGQPIRVIAEFKRASPSAGAIAADASPEPVVRMYEDAGASAISVLTCEKYFDGRLEFLARVRAEVALPVLRKDFIIDSYQIAEARAAGADAVLLIVSALEGGRLAELYHCAADYGLQALVEVHDEAEADRAVAIGAEIVGVNHRNLATFEVDIGLTGRLAKRVPPECILVGESGIRTPEHAEELRQHGAHAILVGESLMRAEDTVAALRELRGKPGQRG